MKLHLRAVKLKPETMVEMHPHKYQEKLAMISFDQKGFAIPWNEYDQDAGSEAAATGSVPHPIRNR